MEMACEAEMQTAVAADETGKLSLPERTQENVIHHVR